MNRPAVAAGGPADTWSVAVAGMVPNRCKKNNGMFTCFVFFTEHETFKEHVHMSSGKQM